MLELVIGLITEILHRFIHKEVKYFELDKGREGIKKVHSTPM